MKKLFLFLAMIFLASPAFATTTWYVSNLAANGYALGVDTNNGTSKSTPFLDNCKAVASASNGDTIIDNPTTTGSYRSANHPYSENCSAAGYLQMGALVATLEGDPSYVSTYTNNTGNYAVIQGEGIGEGRVINYNTSGAGSVLQNIVVDGQGVSFGSGAAITLHTQSGITLNNALVVNIVAGEESFSLGTGSGNTVTMIDDSIDASNVGTTFAIIQQGTLTIQGGNYTSTAASQKIYQVPSGSSTVSISAAKDSNGSQIIMAGSEDFLYLSSSSGSVSSITLAGFNNNNIIHLINMQGSTLSGPVNINNFTMVLGSNSTSNSWLQNFNQNTTGAAAVTIHDGTISDISSYAGDDVGIYNASNAYVYNLKITHAGTGHTILIGSDGFISNETNTATTTGGQNLADTTADTFVDQFITTAAAGANTYAGRIVFELKKTGTPTGNITLSIYADNAGNPGTLVEASNTTLPAASLTTGYLPYEFNFALRSNLTVSTKYHFVITSTIAISASNFVTIAENTTTTQGSILTSILGTTIWVANTSNALMYYYQTGPYEITAPVAFGNIYSCTNTTAEVHGIIIAATQAGTINNNVSYGCGIGDIFKLTQGTSSNPALIYDNINYTTNPYMNGLLYVKSGAYVDVFNNEYVTVGTAGGTLLGSSVVIGPDNNTAYFPSTAQQNATPPDHITFENNIVIANLTSALYLYNIGGNALNGTCTNCTINYNDVFAAGSANWGEVGSTTYTTFANWQTSNFDANSIGTDPLLTNESTTSSVAGFVPTSSSPVEAAGISTGGVVKNDYYGNLFLPVPDIGAFSISNSSFSSGGSGGSSCSGGAFGIGPFNQA